MARQNRRDIFDPNEIGAFHAVQRTVRRAWLCGLDPVSGKSFEHRRTWIQNRLEELAASFGIDCLSFAVMVTGRQVRHCRVPARESFAIKFSRTQAGSGRR